MKKMLLRVICMLFAVLFLVGLAPVSMAMEGELQLGGNYEERFYDYEPRVWNFTPNETGEYLLYVADSLTGEILGQTPLRNDDLQPGFYAYKLTAGTTYQIQIRLKESYSAPYSDIFRLEKKEPLQSLSLNCTEYTGKRDDYSSVYAEWYPSYYSVDGLQWTSSDSSVVSIEDTYGYECQFRMNKTGTASLTVKLGNLSASCKITVEKATGYWDDYPVWPSNQKELPCSVTTNQGKAFSYTPSQTGTYALHAEGEVHADIHGTSPSHILNQRIATTIKGDYHLVDLVAGETYVVGVAAVFTGGGDGVKTGTVFIEKARTASSITLYGPNMVSTPGITGYVGGMRVVFPVTDPVYAFALTGGYSYSSSNPAIANVEQEKTDGSNHLFLTKDGTCNLTVVTGDTKLVCPVTVKPSPVLAVGKTTTLEFKTGDAYGVTCLFTPPSSGYYTFTIRGSGGTCHIKDTQIGNFIDGVGAMAGWLQGGQTYEVILDVGDENHTVMVSGSGNVPPQDVPEPPKGDEPQEPETPTDPSVPDKPTDPSIPTLPPEDMKPTEPSEPEVPDEPKDPTEPSKPSIPSEPSEPSLPSEPLKPDVPLPELEELADQMGGVYESGQVRVNHVNGEFTASSQQISQLAQTKTVLVIQGDGMCVKLDSVALSAIARQMQGDVSLQIRTDREKHFSDRQKDALNGKTVAGAVSVTLTCGDGQIHGFEGGRASVTVPFTPEDETAEYAVYYLSPEGELEKMSGVVLKDGTLTFETGHFSDYVILRESTEEVPKQPKWLVPVLIVAAVTAAAGAAVLWLRKKR